MTLTITMTTDNAAFEDGPEAEVARILHSYACELADGLRNITISARTLRDVNGNTVGTVTVTP